jgi:hypothetical protein
LGVKNTVRAFKIAKKEDGSNLQILTTNLPDFPQVFFIFLFIFFIF